MAELKSRWMMADITEGYFTIMTRKENVEVLGFVEYYENWKEWQFAPAENTAFTVECLSDLSNFVAELNKERPKG